MALPGQESRATQVAVEVLISGGTARATQLSAETTASGGTARATQLATEAAGSGGTVRGSQVAAEPIVSGGTVRTTQVAIEVTMTPAIEPGVINLPIIGTASASVLEPSITGGAGYTGFRFSPSCNCCGGAGTVCERCATGTSPTDMQVDISGLSGEGFSGGTCDACERWNGTYICEQGLPPIQNCIWQHTEIAECNDLGTLDTVQLQVTVYVLDLGGSNYAIQLDLIIQWWDQSASTFYTQAEGSWRQTYVGKPDCGVSGLAPPVYSSWTNTPGFTCAAPTVSITAL